MLLRFAIKRVLASIPGLFFVTLITFLLLHAAAGSYLPGVILNPSITPEDIQRLRSQLGLADPIPIQYLNWMGIAYIAKSVGLGGMFGNADIQPGLLQGDFGHSLIDRNLTVWSEIQDRLPNSLELAGTAMVIALLISIPLGSASAMRRGSRLDHLLTMFSVTGVSVPVFWLGLLLILIFSVTFHRWGLPWLPSGGAYDVINGGDFFDRLVHLIMPATVLSFGYIAVWSRFVRSSMLEVLSQDYVRTARAKGMSERRVTYVHALRNAIIPVITVVGLELPNVIGGGAIVEIVFGWPGIGRLALERALQFDFTMVQGLTTFAAVLVIGGNLIADILYAVLDPRIRYT